MSHDCNKPLDFALDLDFREILTNPFLDIAARVWEADRYGAFQVCYRSMRRIDDLVDDRKIAGGRITSDEAAVYRRRLDNWLEGVRARRTGERFQKQFVDTLERFGIPFWPWERLCRAMIYDLEHDGFRNVAAFLRYAEGAAIAPAAVFMHLCGVSRASERWRPPGFDIRKAARPLALYSYLVHIIRDFQKDQLRGLNYFADDLLTRYRLTVADLRRVAEGGAASDAVRALIGHYHGLTARYRDEAVRTVEEVMPQMEPRYQLSVQIIYSLYSLVFERVDPARGNFTSAELNPPPEMVQERLQETVAGFRPRKAG